MMCINCQAMPAYCNVLADTLETAVDGDKISPVYPMYENAKYQQWKPGTFMAGSVAVACKQSFVRRL
jgi:hypothetical protein